MWRSPEKMLDRIAAPLHWEIEIQELCPARETAPGFYMPGSDRACAGTRIPADF
jgi:hypothetical protein